MTEEVHKPPFEHHYFAVVRMKQSDPEMKFTRRHPTFEAAEAEAIRISKLNARVFVVESVAAYRRGEKLELRNDFKYNK